uniref:ADP-ribosylation factor-like protein 15 n=1 Tax=Catharus ustulatus TaxID=91951 RepID=A0A8C3U7P5_CATUS
KGLLVQLKCLTQALEGVPHLLVFLLETSDLFAGKLVGRVIKLQGTLIHLLGEGFEAIHLAFHLLQVQAGPRACRDTDGQKKVGTHHLILFSLALALLPGLLIRAGTGEEVLEGITLSQHGVAAHVVHPPCQAFATFRDEVLLKAASGLFLWQVGHRDDRELLSQAPIEPVKVLVAAVHLLAGVAGHQLVGDVALHALEFGLFGGVLDGALEGVRVLLPLGAPGAQHHTQLVPVLHEARRLAQHEGLSAGLDEGGETIEIAAHRGRALGGAAAAGRVRVSRWVPRAAGAQGWLGAGGQAVPARGAAARRLVIGVGAAQGARLVGHRGAVVPVIVPVVIAALTRLCFRALCCKGPPPPRPEYDLVCIGLSGSGKTSLLSQLCSESPENIVSTTGFSIKAVPFQNAILNVKELGGADNIRKYWSRYYQGSQGVIFVLDSASSEDDLETARNELHSALQHPQLCTLPFLILANHQDKPAARSVQETSA